MVPEYTGTAAQGFGCGARWLGEARSGLGRAKPTGWCRRRLWLRLGSGNGAGRGYGGGSGAGGSGGSGGSELRYGRGDMK